MLISVMLMVTTPDVICDNNIPEKSNKLNVKAKGSFLMAKVERVR
jgi:hypothetical protein